MNAICSFCGKPLGINDKKTCPVCGNEILRYHLNGTYEIDVAHDNETWLDAKEKIDKGINHVLKNNIARLRIIHGWGSGDGHTNVIKNKAILYLREQAMALGAKYLTDKNNKGASFLDFND